MTLWIKPHAGKENKTRLESGEFDCWDTPPPANTGWLEATEVRLPKTKPDYEQCYGNHYLDLTKTPAEIVWPVKDFSPAEVTVHKKDVLDRENAVVMAKLAARDTKKARAITDALLTGDKTRLEALEAEAAVLRGQIKTTM